MEPIISLFSPITYFLYLEGRLNLVKGGSALFSPFLSTVSSWPELSALWWALVALLGHSFLKCPVKFDFLLLYSYSFKFILIASFNYSWILRTIIALDLFLFIMTVVIFCVIFHLGSRWVMAPSQTLRIAIS